MGELSFIPKKKICRIESMKVSVLVPTPLCAGELTRAEGRVTAPLWQGSALALGLPVQYVVSEILPSVDYRCLHFQ